MKFNKKYRTQGKYYICKDRSRIDKIKEKIQILKMVEKIPRIWLAVFTLTLPMIFFLIYYIFFANLSTVFYLEFPKGNEKIKIRGLALHAPSGLLQTPELARSTGANWYHIKVFAILGKNGECKYIPGEEIWLRYQIRRAHKVGLKVLLVPFIPWEKKMMMPGKIGLPQEIWDEYHNCITNFTLWVAKIAQEENVEMIGTANEVYYYTSEEDMSEWLQFVLPKIREIYNGKIVVSFYPQIYNLVEEIKDGSKSERDFERVLAINVSGYDYIAPCGTPNEFSSIEELHEQNREIIKRFNRIYNKWNVKVIFLEVNAPEARMEKFWEIYLRRNMTRSQIRAMVYREWVKDFSNVSFVDGWFFIEWAPNNFLIYFERNPPDERYTFGWQTDEVYKTIKEIYGG